MSIRQICITPRFRAESTGERITLFGRRIVGELSLESCCGRPMMRNSVLEGLRVRKFADIQFETFEMAVSRRDIL